MLVGIDHIAQDDDVRAWVIRALPEPSRRQELAAYIRADEVLVLNPGMEILYARATARGSYGTREVIDYWLAHDCTEVPNT